MLPGFTALEKQCYVPSSIEKSRVRFIVTLLCCGEASEKVLCCQHPVPIPTWPLMIRLKVFCEIIVLLKFKIFVSA